MSKKERDWVGAGFGAVPKHLSDNVISRYFHETLSLNGDDLYEDFRRFVDALDEVWMDDHTARAKRRAEEEKQKRNRGKGRHDEDGLI